MRRLTDGYRYTIGVEDVRYASAIYSTDESPHSCICYDADINRAILLDHDEADAIVRNRDYRGEGSQVIPVAELPDGRRIAPEPSFAVMTPYCEFVIRLWEIGNPDDSPIVSVNLEAAWTGDYYAAKNLIERFGEDGEDMVIVQVEDYNPSEKSSE